MKHLLQAEQAAQLAIAIFALWYQPIHLEWYIWIPFFLSPDISMLGYLINNRAGAALYNLAHHKAVAVVLIGAGYFYNIQVTLLIGLMLYAHSSFDRLMGYGLKYNDSFSNTHLGLIGKKK